MKLFFGIMLGLALVVGVFGIQPMTGDSIMATSHNMTEMNCADGSCTPMEASDCAAHCLSVASLSINSGILPTSNTLLLVLVAAVIALAYHRQSIAQTSSISQLIKHRDPRRLLCILKRE